MTDGAPVVASPGRLEMRLGKKLKSAPLAFRGNPEQGGEEGAARNGHGARS